MRINKGAYYIAKSSTKVVVILIKLNQPEWVGTLITHRQSKSRFYGRKSVAVKLCFLSSLCISVRFRAANSAARVTFPSVIFNSLTK